MLNSDNESHYKHSHLFTLELVVKLQKNSCQNKVDMDCVKKHSITWSSSKTIDHEKKTMMSTTLRYLASGIAPIQYEQYSDFSHFELLSDHFCRSLVKFSAISKNLCK